MWNWWQHIPENLSPTLLRIGSFELRYYGLMYVLAFIIGYALARYRIKDEKWPYDDEQLSNFFIYLLFGVIIGGRLGYVLFYNLSYFIQNPLEIFLPFDINNGFQFTGIAGMSYHGGVIGVIIAGILLAKKYNTTFWNLADLLVPTIPLGYTFGRLGNFINGELYGRVTTVPWGMYFPQSFTNQLRHPSQLYEAFAEGIILFVILWVNRKNPKWKNQFLPI